MTKRANGEGSIYQRASDGRFCATISLGYDSRGKPRRKTFYGKSKKEVRDKLKVAQALVEAGVQIGGQRQTVGVFLELWIEKVKKPRVREASYITYKSFLDKHLVPALGRIEISKLQPQQVQQFLSGLLESGLAPGTVQYAHTVLKMALEQAVKWGMVARNVAALVDPPTGRPEERPVLSADEARQFLQTVAGERNAIVYSLALYLGMRRGEILGLRWTDIDWKKQRIQIRKTLLRIDDGAPVFGEPKTKGSRRTLPLPPALLATLRTHQARQAEERIGCTDWQHHNLVVTDEYGGPIDGTNLLYRFQKYLATAGLPNLHFHDLRHSCATLLADEGVPPRVIMDILGHSNMKITTLTYTHALDDGKQSAVDALERVLDAG